ncbi:hypothetical protein [Staphylococcus saprophyticus]|uniref:hypothetical protein n=1 Tax=Staphylococcus saprophyticus TaxID=29385 RepID=UPI002DB784B7|nr:hypothetical protein [Staphylococcus saprophyticus]MEB8335779.1 hypothetical protein [Staphylococcus saprophyticus]
MVKIKQKKTMNLPQLIEWVWENGIKNERFIHSDSNPPEYVWINENSNVELDEDMCISKTDTFTVEVEEEITEDTEISILAHYSVFGFKTTKSNASINEEKGGNSIAFYIMNDDKTMTLIWKNGKLVE